MSSPNGVIAPCIDFFFSLYRSQLKQAGAAYVLHFQLYQGNRLVYAIFFGT